MTIKLSKKNLGVTKENMDLNDIDDEYYCFRCDNSFYITQKEWMEHLKQHKINKVIEDGKS